MIRVNLLGGEKQQKARKAPSFDASHRLTAACSLILVVAALGIGWWYWSLRQASAGVDAEIAAAQQEKARLSSLMQEVQAFEARRGQLQQRVALIERLRKGQSLPVQLLDHVSRSLPEMLWLTSLQQDGAAVTIEGRSTTLIGVSDFVGSLANTELLQKPIEIVKSEVETPTTNTNGQPAVELVKFTVKAQVAAGAAPAAASTKK